MATTTVVPIEGTFKTTQTGNLVIVVNHHYVGRLTSAGEVVTVVSETDGAPLTPGREFRVDGKGQPFGHFKNQTQKREQQNVYLYVTEITPTVETCAACGDARGQFCPMSADGEGPHEIVRRSTVSQADAALLDRYEVHMEQGAQER